MIPTLENTMEKITFTKAIEHHQLMLAMFGGDDPRTVEAIQLVMLLAPLELFAEIEQMAHATRH